MILHRDLVSMGDGYRLSESAFVKIEVIRVPADGTHLRVVFTRCDALNQVHGVTVSEPFPLAQLSVAVAECLPIDLDGRPRGISESDRCLSNWSDRPLGDRALIHLHTVYDNNRIARWRVSYFDFLLLLLEHAAGLRLTFVMDDDRVTEIQIFFGCQEKSGFMARGVPARHLDIWRSLAIPLSETSET